MRAGHIERKQAHQRAVVQPGCAQLEAYRGHAQAGGGGVAQQADVVELRALDGFGPVQAGGVEPAAPGLERAAQQRQAFEIGGLLERPVGAHKRRRGQGGEHIARQLHMFHVGVMAGAEAHDQVGIFRHHVEQWNAHMQRQVDLGVGLGELAQPRNQHAAGKCRRDGDLQPAPAGRAGAAGKALQRAQAFTHMRQIGAAFAGQREIGPPEQPAAQHLLELAHPVAHGAGRDAQLLGGLRHAAQPRQRLEGQQALDGGDAPRGTGHGRAWSGRGHGVDQRKTTVLWPLRMTRRSLCHLTARASTWLSVSRPRAVRSSTVSVWSARATSCSMIGPSSRSAVT